MKAATALLAASLLAAAIQPAPAAGLKIGIVAPLSGSFQTLGQQVVTGAQAAAAELSGGTKISIATVDDKCTEDGGAAAARDLISQNVDIVVGFLCTDALEAALPVLGGNNLAVITPGVRAPGLAEQRASARPPVFRLQSRPGLEAEAAAGTLARIWRDKLFAIIDDGTIYGRDLAETVRLDLQQKGLKSVFDDTYRPGLDNQAALIIRLKRAGATNVFVGGQRDDVAVIGRDAAKLGDPLVIAGGEALRAAPGNVDLQAGTLMIAPPLFETLPSASAADAAIIAAGGVPEGYVVPAYAAIEVASQAFANAATSSTPVGAVLAQTEFATAIGPVRFGADGDREGNPYQLYRYDGQHFLEVDN